MKLLKHRLTTDLLNQTALAVLVILLHSVETAVLTVQVSDWLQGLLISYGLLFWHERLTKQ